MHYRNYRKKRKQKETKDQEQKITVKLRRSKEKEEEEGFQKEAQNQVFPNVIVFSVDSDVAFVNTYVHECMDKAGFIGIKLTLIRRLMSFTNKILAEKIIFPYKQARMQGFAVPSPNKIER